MNMLKIGLDIHGVIDTYPELFSELSHMWVNSGNKVHVITGQPQVDVRHKVEKANILFTHFYSIVDYHQTKNTKMWQDEKGLWWMDEKIWAMSKGEYAGEVRLDVHFDDSRNYMLYFPRTCAYIRVPSSGFGEMIQLLDIMKRNRLGGI